MLHDEMVREMKLANALRFEMRTNSHMLLDVIFAHATRYEHTLLMTRRATIKSSKYSLKLIEISNILLS